MVENCFYGVLPLLQSAERPPVFGIGVTPLSYSSRDAIFMARVSRRRCCRRR